MEWYQYDLAVAPVEGTASRLNAEATALGPRVRLLLTMTAPVDGSLYALFAAESATTVTLVCAKAGWPADRITAVGAKLNSPTSAPG